jgi:hypothetical protein
MYWNVLYVVPVLLFIGLTMKYLLEVQAFLKQMADAHNALWHEMGAPQLKFQFGDRSYQNAMRYIREHRFSALEDEVLESHYQTIKKLEKSAIVIFIVLFLLPFAEFFMAAH